MLILIEFVVLDLQGIDKTDPHCHVVSVRLSSQRATQRATFSGCGRMWCLFVCLCLFRIVVFRSLFSEIERWMCVCVWRVG